MVLRARKVSGAFEKRAQGKPNFYNICPYTKDIVYRRFEDFITLLCLFMNVVKVFERLELWVNVPVAIFFPTEDCYI